MINTMIQGKKFSIDTELNLITPEKTFSKSQMQSFANESKGMNRIYKPMALLFWIDIKNGKKSNWNIF